MSEFIQYLIDNSIITLPFLALVIEFFLRKIPTFQDVSILSNLDKLMNLLAKNKVKTKDRHTGRIIISTLEKVASALILKKL